MVIIERIIFSIRAVDSSLNYYSGGMRILKISILSLKLNNNDNSDLL